MGHQWISAPGEAASASPRAKLQTRKPHLSNGYDQPQDFGGWGGGGGTHWNLHERYITPKPPNGTHCPSHAPAPDQSPNRGVGTDQGPVWGRRLITLTGGGGRDPLATALALPALLRCSPDRSSGQSTAGAASQGAGPSSKEHVRHHLPTGPTVHTSNQASLQNSPSTS